MPRAVDHDARRSRLARATADVIAGSGLEAAGLREVARASDLTTGALTHYFASKAELLDAAYEAAMERLLARQQDWRAADAPPHGAALVALLADILPLDPDALRDWRVWLAFSARALVDERLRGRHRDYYARITATLAAELGGGPDARALADLLVAIVDGLGVRIMLEPGDWPRARVEATLALALPHLFAATEARP